MTIEPRIQARRTVPLTSLLVVAVLSVMVATTACMQVFGVDKASSNDDATVSGFELPNGTYTSPVNGREYELLYADDFASDPFGRPDWDEGWIEDSEKRSGLVAGEYNIWESYDQGPSTAHLENSWWLSKNVRHEPGRMQLASSWDPSANSDRKYPGQVGRLSTGALSASHLANTIKYGRWDIAWRMDASTHVMYAIMLYGSSGAYWPLYVELDIAEGNGDGKNDSLYSTIHYETADGEHGKSQLTPDTAARKPFTNWHRLSVDFSPNRLDYFLNGVRVVSAVTARSAGREPSGDCSQLLRAGRLEDKVCYVPDEAIPDDLSYRGRDLGPRTFIFQTEAAADATERTPAPVAEIDWVAMYRLMN